MGKISPKQIPKTIHFLQVDFPVLLCQVGKIEDTDEYWEEVNDKCQKCYEKYKSDFVKIMILALCHYLEQKWKERNESGKNVTEKTS